MSWQGDRLLLLDQQKLPSEIKQINCFDYLAVADAIRTMKVRGHRLSGLLRPSEWY